MSPPLDSLVFRVGVGSALILAALATACRERIAHAEVKPARERSTVWSSAADCLALLSRGDRLPRRPGDARIGSWNVKWFPDGDGPGQPTDLAWLACGIAYLGPDVLAVQEFKRTERARLAAEELCARLGTLTGDEWRYRLDDCPSRGAQHVGFVWNASRAEVSAFRMLASLNPHAGACDGQLRPGLAGYFRFRGGLDAQVVSLHFKSKTDERSFGLRRRSWQGLRVATAELLRGNADTDWIFAGDYNSMGCERCAAPVSAEDERGQLGRALIAARLQLLPANAAFTEYSRGRALLDHFAVSTATRELPPAAMVRVEGYCAEPARPRRRPHPAREQLSDHCPILLDLRDRDLD